MLNRVVLAGRLVSDPEVRYTASGVAVASFRIAVDRQFKDKGTGQREADFISCVAWRQRAEFASNYLRKGRLIAVEGRLQTRSYTAKDGTRRYVVEVVVDGVSTLDRPKGAGGEGGAEEAVGAREEIQDPFA